MKNELLYTLFLENPYLPEAIHRFCQTLPEYGKAQADYRRAAEELAAATRSEVVQVIGTKFVLYRESHSKPKEKRIQLVSTKPARTKNPTGNKKG